MKKSAIASIQRLYKKLGHMRQKKASGTATAQAGKRQGSWRDTQDVKN